MRKQLLALVGLITVTGVALAAVPEGTKPQGPQGKERRMERKAHLKEALGLTDAQLADLKKLRSEQEKKKIRMKADAKIARLELRELMLAPTVDEKAVRAKAKQVSDLHAAAANDRVEAMLALRKIVSAEQAEKLMKMKQHGRRGPGHGPRHQMGPRGPRHGGPQGPGSGPARQPRGPRVGDAADAEDQDAEEMPAL